MIFFLGKITNFTPIKAGIYILMFSINFNLIFNVSMIGYCWSQYLNYIIFYNKLWPLSYNDFVLILFTRYECSCVLYFCHICLMTNLLNPLAPELPFKF